MDETFDERLVDAVFVAHAAYVEAQVHVAEHAVAVAHRAWKRESLALATARARLDVERKQAALRTTADIYARNRTGDALKIAEARVVLSEAAERCWDERHPLEAENEAGQSIRDACRAAARAVDAAHNAAAAAWLATPDGVLATAEAEERARALRGDS